MTDPPYDTSDLTPAQAEAAFLVDASPGPNGVTPWREADVLSAEEVARNREAAEFAISIGSENMDGISAVNQARNSLALARSHEQLRRERDALAYALEKIAQGTWNVGRERGDVDVRKFAREALAALEPDGEKT